MMPNSSWREPVNSTRPTLAVDDASLMVSVACPRMCTISCGSAGRKSSRVKPLACPRGNCVGAGEADAVVQAELAVLPKLDLGGDDAEAGPMPGARDRVVAEIGAQLFHRAH